MIGFFSLINLARGLPWKLIGIFAIIASAFVGGCQYGAKIVTANLDAERAETEIKFQQLVAKQAQATTQVVTQYVDRVKVVKQRGADIVKEVKVYVSTQADSACDLPGGFRVLHDAAASQSEFPDPTRAVDARPASVEDVAATVAENYTTYHEVAEQLIALQSWVKQQEQVQ